MQLLAFVACDPCSHWNGADVLDREDLVDDATEAGMRQTVDDFYAWTGATDACVDAVSVTDLGGERYDITADRAPTVYIDDDLAHSDHILRAALCTELDARRGLSEEAGEDIVDACSYGPTRFDWLDEVIAACGGTELGSVDAFVRDHVWVDAPGTPDHGDLGLTLGTPSTYTGLSLEGGSVYQVAADGDGIVVQSYAGPLEDRDVQVTLFDPWTGATIAAIPLDDTGTLHGGPDRAFHDALGDDGLRTLTTIAPDGTTAAVRTDAPVYENATAVAGGWLYAGHSPTDQLRPLQSASLTTGEVRQIDLPAAPDGLLPLVNQLVGVGDALLVQLLHASVDMDCSTFDCVVTIVIWDEIWAIYEPVGGTWAELDDAFAFSPSGTTSDGAVVGRLRADAGSLYAAWDPVAGTISVSEDVCAATYGDFSLVTGDTAWWASTSDDDAALTVWPVQLGRTQGG